MKHLIGLLLLATSACTQVTATVTVGDVNPPQGTYQVVVLNDGAQKAYPYAVRTWTSKEDCLAAVGNANVVFAALADDNVPAEQTPEFAGSDRTLSQGFAMLVLTIAQQTGEIPKLTANCVLKDARPA
jgi:hypothetical protein